MLMKLSLLANMMRHSAYFVFLLLLLYLGASLTFISAQPLIEKNEPEDASGSNSAHKEEPHEIKSDEDLEIDNSQVVVDPEKDPELSESDDDTVEDPQHPKTEQGSVDHKIILQAKETKRNKVGFVLAQFHKLSEKSAYKKDKKVDPKVGEEMQKILSMDPETMLTKLCPSSLGICTNWVKKSFDKNSPTIHHIAHSIKTIPEGVDPRKLFKHKIYEAAAGTVVEKGHDKTLDTVINIAASKNPVLLASVTGIDMALKAH